MTQSTLHSPPRTRDVLREQISAVGLALRTPATAAAALLAVATVLVIGERITGGGPVDFAPELSMVPGVLGALFPIGVWKGEKRFGASLLWTLPVDRRRHALAKVCAGWMWLMALVAMLILWFLVMALFTGGNILGDQVIQLLPSATVPAPGTLDPSMLRTIHWAPQPLLWLVPFTAATGTYLLASAFALGTRHPIRWLAGIFIGTLLLSAGGAAAHVDSLRLGPSRLLEIVHEGRYGLDALFTARSESLSTLATLSNGRTVNVWRGLPDLGQWAAATLLWTSIGLLTLWAAASRHGERRRGALFYRSE
jgi:hypothetical protein